MRQATIIFVLASLATALSFAAAKADHCPTSTFNKRQYQQCVEGHG
jgi:hypothetical protein